MMEINPDKLTYELKKPRSEFTKKDIIKFFKNNGIKMLQFNYTGADGRLKTLSFAINSESHLEELLECGERVDGSSLFPYIESTKSDLYVIPRFSTAFINPFTEIPTLNILCSYFDADGKESKIAPEYIVKKAHKTLKEKTGITLEALGELEYYVMYKQEENDWFPGTPQKNYHESSPFVKFEQMKNEILYAVSSVGAKVKYGHSEVGNITLPDGTHCEQYELEFLPEPLEEMADHVVIAKWMMRNIAVKYGVGLTFAPKLAPEHAGTGLHIHLEPVKNGKNVAIDNSGKLSITAKKIIGGLLELSPSLTAFGNTNPTSYLRLVPHQEAPTYICWGDKNRSALVRIPLGWTVKHSMSKMVNKGGKNEIFKGKQTIELRSPDGSANIHLLLAGIAVATRYGLTNNDSIRLAEETYIGTNKDNKKVSIKHLPASCYESAEKLREQQDIYMQGEVFNQKIIDGIINRLKKFEDKDLRSNKERIKEYIEEFINCG